MFARTTTYADIEAAEHELNQLERVVARARARQVELLAWLDDVKVARVHGSRSLEEWTSAHLDVAPTTARDLVAAARASGGGSVPAPPRETSFDRKVATIDLVTAGATQTDVAASFERDLAGVKRHAAKLRRLTRLDERSIVRQRHIAIEPTLGETAWRISGLAPSIDGHLISSALQRRADELPNAPAGEREGRGARMLDALTALAQDYLDAGCADADARQAQMSSATLFVDAALAADSESERGGVIAAGPRVGPDTIDRALCGGNAAIVALTNGRPVLTTHRTSQIPPAVRDAVLHRDRGCVVDSCRSRYRLEPHHIRHREHGGDHDLDNLATLCWYHHHIAIHGYGKQLDPGSPPLRRRFLRPGGPEPP